MSSAANAKPVEFDAGTGDAGGSESGNVEDDDAAIPAGESEVRVLGLALVDAHAATRNALEATNTARMRWGGTFTLRTPLVRP